VFGKGSVSNSAFPMNLCSICDENRVVSSRMVQQLSSGKSLLMVWSLAKQEEKSACPKVWLIDVPLFSSSTSGRWQEVTLLLSHASLLPAV